MNCTLSVKETPLTKALLKEVGNDSTAFYSYYGNVMAGEDFKPEFKKWYKDTKGKEPNINAKSQKGLASAIIEYYAQSPHSVNSTVRTDRVNNDSLAKGYVTALDREEGKKHAAVMILNDFNAIQNTGSEIKGNKLNHYKLALKNAWNNAILNVIADKKGKDIKVIKEEYFMATDKLGYIEDNIGERGTVENNLMAVWKELNGSETTSNRYIREVFANPILQHVRTEVDEDLKGDINEEMAADANADLNEENNEDGKANVSEELDMAITVLNNHMGTYTTFMSHVSARIANYFNSLTALEDTTKDANGNYKTNNSNRFGLPVPMDAVACTSMLYNSGIFNNKTTMINSIRNIANTIPGFEAFAKLANDLEANPDFATEMFTVFARTVMQKLETVLEGDKGTVRISNERADPRTAMLFDCRNDLKGTVVSIDRSFATRQANDALDVVGSRIKRESLLPIEQEHVDQAILDTTRLVRLYYPSAQESAIESYINSGETNKEKLKKARNLLWIVRDTAKYSEDSYNNYLSREAEATRIKNENRERANQKSRGNWSDEAQTKLKSVYSKDYLTSKQDGELLRLVGYLLPYSAINTSLNSRNVYGNNSSDVINNSLITKIKKMLKNTRVDEFGAIHNDQLEAWGEDLFRSSQYNYDALMMEQYDEDGKPINKALFRRDEDGKLVLTSNYQDWLDLYLFNGASNLDDGSNILYSESTMGDYFPTDFINYHANQEYGHYFLRTPSDAPKTFCIKAPKYSTFGLYQLENPKEHEAKVKAIGQDYRQIDVQEFKEKFQPKHVDGKRNEDAVMKALRHQGKLIVPNLEAVTHLDDRDFYVVMDPEYARRNGETVEAYTERAANRKFYIFEGNLKKHDTYTELEDYSLYGVTGADNNNVLSDNMYNALTSYYSDKLLDGDVTYKGKIYDQSKRVINKNHPVFKLIRNQFKQEMVNAASALDHYFELETIDSDEVNKTTTNVVYIDKSTDEGVSAPKFKAGVNPNDGYKFYHLGSDGKVMTPITVGTTVVGYRFGGNVFKSSKFTLNVTDENGNINTTNFFDGIIGNEVSETDPGMINFLYGGASHTNSLKIIKDKNDKVIDVEFSEAQQEDIDNRVANFLDAYSKDCYRRASEYKQFIRGTKFTFDTCTDFSINNLIMHYNYDTLFEGDTKFYKDSQTVLKRAKEYQGSGVPYGIADYTERDSEGIHEIEGSYLNEGIYDDVDLVEKEDEDGYTYDEEVPVKRKVQDIVSTMLVPDKDGNLVQQKTEIKQRNKFFAVTVANSQETNDVALAQLCKRLQDLGMKQNDAESLLYGPVEVVNGVKQTNPDGTYKRRGGFTDTKVNDAQSYITYEEWVRRIAARGQLQRYLPLIKKLNDPNSKLSGDEIKEFVQVQKNFYYDLYYNKRYNLRVPRQIKNAEFVLIPRFIKGTQLEHVYNMMKDAGVDQLNTVETSKAANEKVLTLWDNHENISDETLKSFVSDAQTYKQMYSYNNLYTQQETPQHMNSKNKAGIQIVKKIIDNLPANDARKAAYFRLFGQNIFDSYNTLMDELGVERDANGNIIYDEATGQLAGIDMKVFYEKFEDELMRRNIDSNMLDYVTLDDTGKPLMPSYMTSQLTTLEQSIQAMFNSSITRQKLPGFHAAQVTNVGLKPLKTKLKDVTYDKELHYHPMKKVNGKEIPQGHIEVKIPASYLGIDRNSPHYKNMTDKQIIEELEDEGLGFIGYRIPTEGKQSACNMKVVGLLSDAQGSTIVVPNDWVSQTGSDFDIDSVYSIQYETYKTADGQVKKVRYIGKSSTNNKNYDATIWDYVRYLKDFGATKVNAKVSEDITNAKEEISQAMNEAYEEIQEIENQAYSEFIDALPEEIREDSIQGWKDIAKDIREQYKGESKNFIYGAQMHAYMANLEDFKANVEAQVEEEGDYKELLESIDKLHNACRDLYDFLADQSDELQNRNNTAIKEILENRLANLEAAAQKSGLLSFEDYKQAVNERPEVVNSRKARNNEILTIMQNILNSPEALEENLSRSNFDKISEALSETMNPNVKAERKGRSPYNPFDQMAYQEDAMSGAKLKAFSVTLDTFCSVCNNVQPTLTNPIYIVYNKEQFKDDNFKDIQKRFGSAVNGTTAIRHTMYGYSNDNRNMDNMILTSYSSQTTAYILDAIKEGAIPNVNDYTFAAFKTLANIGVDYKTSISFIMQPGIKRIVDAYNSNKSIYSKYNSNPIFEAIRGIGKELGFEVDYKTPVMTLLNQINARYNEQFNEIFNQKGDEPIKIALGNEATKDLPILADKCLDRLKDKGIFDPSRPVKDVVSKPLFDLGVILAFNRINKTANEIGDIARCCNPDKFGAKQSVFATNKVFEDIQNLMYNSDGLNKMERTPALAVNGKHILASIYPGIENGMQGLIAEDRSDESGYPTLYNYLKYATSTSVIIGRHVLDTQKPQFVHVVNALADTFSGANPKLDEKTYNDFQKYVLTHYYNKVPTIAKPVVWNKEEGRFTFDINGDEVEERKRIYGYERASSLHILERGVTADGKPKLNYKTFNVENIVNPSQEELNEFAKFSPAQKVQWIKRTFEDAGYFNLLNVQLDNDARRGYRVGMQTIEFQDETMNRNAVYEEFNRAFYNDNPLIAMAAYDVVKYAIQVEGMRLTARGISKTIDNDVLIEDFGRNGTGFVSLVDEQINGTQNDLDGHDELIDEVCENYLRSHADSINKIRTYYMDKKSMDTYGVVNVEKANGILSIKADPNAKDSMNEFNTRLEKMGVKWISEIDGSDHINKYLKIHTKRDGNVVYKIEDLTNEVLLYPLNKLNANEDAEFSANDEYNNYRPASYYKEVINNYRQQKADNAANNALITQIAESVKASGEFAYAKTRRQYKAEAMAADFNLNELAKQGGNLAQIHQQIVNHLNSLNFNNELYIFSRPLSSFIFNPGAAHGSIQSIDMGNGKKYKVIISKVNADAKLRANDGTRKSWNQAFLDKKLTKKQRQEKIDKIDNDTVRNAYTAANEAGFKSVQDLFVVTPYTLPEDNEAFAATSLEEANLAGYQFATIQMGHSEENAVTAVENLRSSGVINTIQSLKDNSVTATRTLAKYAHDEMKRLKTNFNQFVVNPENTDEYFKITDPVVQDMIAKDRLLEDKYLATLNQIGAYKQQFAEYRDFDYSSEDAEIRRYLDDIKDSLSELEKLPAEEASNIYNRTRTASLSSNPLIKEQVIDVMDNYYRSYGSMWMFHDIAENGNPLVQITLRRVFDDLETKRMAALQDKRDFEKAINKIIEEANKHGIQISLDDVIDEHGRLIQDYSNEFIDELADLCEKQAAARRTAGNGSYEYLRAKNDLDRFKAKYIHQEAKPMYYIEKASAEKTMLDKHRVIYTKYMELYNQQMDIFSGAGHNDLTAEERIRLNKIRTEMANLVRPGHYYDENGEAHERPYAEPGVKYSEEFEQTLALYGAAEAKALNDFLADAKARNNRYFRYDAEYGFEDQLRTNLNIISSFEKRRNGLPTVPADVLNSIPAYREAKEWVQENAMFHVDIALDENGKPTGIGADIIDAFNVLSLNKKARNKTSNDIMKNANDGKGIYDERRIPNGNLLTEAERASIKDAQESAYRTKNLPKGSDRVLISNANPTGDIYNKSFYEGILGKEGIKDNPTYIATVTELNKHLEKYYDEIDGVVHFDRIEDTEEGRAELQEIANLYQKLRAIRNMDASKGSIADYVEFVTNEDAFNNQKTHLDGKSLEFKQLWGKVNLETDAHGNIIVKKDGKNIANRMLYSYAKPKGEVGSKEYEQYVDHERSKAIATIDKVYRKVATKYYYEAMHEAENKAKADPSYKYKDWYDANHVYNPYTRKFEPIECWLNTEVRDEHFYGEDETPSGDKVFKGQWEPTPNNRKKTVRDGSEIGEEDMRNPEWKHKASYAENYKLHGWDGKYDNDSKLNEYQKQLRDHVRDTIQKLARVYSAQKYFNKGYLPMEAAQGAMTGKEVVKELGKMVGVSLDNTENGKKEFYDEVGYESDVVPRMPMTDELVSKEKVTVSDGDNLEDALNSERTIKYDVPRPTDEAALEEWNANLRKVREHNRAIAEGLMNKDWSTVLGNFILKASNYNAIMDNREKLYYTLEMLKRQKAYSRKYGFTGGLKEDTRRTTEEAKAYVGQVDENLVKQYENLLNRLLWNQYKQPESKLTKLSNGIQGFTSANYMMLNLRGGIANVTVGVQSMLGEMFAGEHYDAKDWGFGIGKWQQNMFSFIINSGKETSNNLVDAVIKAFNVVDYDELQGVVTEVGLKEKFKKARDLGFSTQSAGEHLMQNGVLLAMLHGHKLVTIANDPRQIGYACMNEREYIDYKQAEILSDVLNDSQKAKFAEWKKTITADKGKVAEYAWFRRDMLTEFLINHLSKEQRKEFNAKRDEAEAKLKEDFAKKDNIFNQLELSEDGYMTFKKDSDLGKLNEQPLDPNNPTVTKALALMGTLSEKVKRVNNKIHGVYNKVGRAYIERTWYGSLVMQYHKHLPMGLMKRYMTRGHWNEFRNSVDKGMVASCMDFLSLNLRATAKDMGLNPNELNAAESLQVLLKGGLSYLSNLKLTWHTMPRYERANIKRNLGDFIGVLAGLMTVVALKAAGDDDDDSIGYNLALYEADRLASESFMYNPIGLMSETKTLMSTPIASQSIISDAGQAIYQLGAMVMQGEDFDPIYHSGRFAGESKLSVYVQRRIPMWNGIRSVIDSPANNHYYKLGDTAATIVPTGAIADWIKK